MSRNIFVACSSTIYVRETRVRGGIIAVVQYRNHMQTALMTIFQFTPEEVMEIRVGTPSHVNNRNVRLAIGSKSFTSILVSKKHSLITVKQCFDLLRRMQHDRVHIDVAVLRIVHSVEETFILAGEHTTCFQLHASSQLWVDGIELVVDEQIHLRHQQLGSLFNDCRGRN